MQPSIIKKYCTTLCCVVLVILAGSCKKQKVVESNFAVFQIYGAVEGDDPVVANFSGKELPGYLNAYNVNDNPMIGEGNRKYIYEHSQPFALYAFPDTVAGSKPAFFMDLQLEMGKTYSFFVGGRKNSLDTIFFREDSIPVFNTDDSSSAMRFVNFLSQTPLKINRAGEPYGSLVSYLPYKGRTGFIKIPVPSTVTEISLEFRHAVTGELMLTYTDDDVQGTIGNRRNWLFKPRTMLLSGIPGVDFGNDRPIVEQIIHY